jgi:hypothetical protein
LTDCPKRQDKQEDRVSCISSGYAVPSHYTTQGLPLFSPTPFRRSSRPDRPQTAIAAAFISSENVPGFSPVRGKKSIPSNPRPGISFNGSRMQLPGWSSIPAHSTHLPGDPGLHNLQQCKSNDDLVRDILHNGKSQEQAPGLCKAFEPSGDDVKMQDATQPKEQQSASSIDMLESTKQSGCVAHKTGPAFPPRGVVLSTQLKSPGRPTFVRYKDIDNDMGLSRMEDVVTTSQAQSVTTSVHQSSSDLPSPALISQDATSCVVPKLVQTYESSLTPAPPTGKTTPNKNSGEPTAGFDIPALPDQGAIVNPTPAPTASTDRRRNGTVLSEASSRTLPRSSAYALKDPCIQHEAATMTECRIRPTPDGTLPRKGKRVVSVSSDEESEFGVTPPSSPAEFKRTWAKTSAKKARVASGFGSSASSNKAKRFGFKRPRTQQRGVRSITPPLSSSGGKPAPSIPSAQKGRKTLIQTPPTPTSPLMHPALRNLDPRSAKVAAKSRIHTCINEIEECQANERDEIFDYAPVVVPTSDQLRRRMRGLSLTPAPSTNGSVSNINADRTERIGSVYTSAQWTRDRMNGDRYLAKSKASSKSWDESEGEVDYSAINARVIGGRIIFSSTEKMDLTRIVDMTE